MKERIGGGQKGRGATPNEWKMCMIKTNLLIFCQIICIEKLFTLILIIYISYHIIFLEFLYTSMNAEIDAINKFVLYNTEAMQQWVVLYEEKIKKWDSDRKAFRGSDGRIVPYPYQINVNINASYIQQ